MAYKIPSKFIVMKKLFLAMEGDTVKGWTVIPTEEHNGILEVGDECEFSHFYGSDPNYKFSDGRHDTGPEFTAQEIEELCKRGLLKPEGDVLLWYSFLDTIDHIADRYRAGEINDREALLEAVKQAAEALL
jgi:hypothetical protein